MLREYSTCPTPVVGLQELVDRVGAWRQRRERVVLCHGRFDPLHIGHVYHFEAARALGDRLVVTVTPDRFAQTGPGRPFLGEEERAAMAASIRCVDAAAVNHWATATELLELVRPDVFAKGIDYSGHSDSADYAAECAVAERHGIAVCLTRTPKLSSTKLLHALTTLDGG